MSYHNLAEFVKKLEGENELLRISTYVNPQLEIAEITDRVSKSPHHNKALLFENTGYEFPVLMNAYGSERRMCMALGVQGLNDIACEIEDLFKLISSPKNGLIDKLKMLPKLSQFAGWMPRLVSGKGECQEILMAEPDLGKLPVITCWPQDGGPFLTLPVIHTKDPLTGMRNVGMYRMQVFDKTLTGMHWHRHKVSAKHFTAYQKLHKKMPVAVSLGGDPVYGYCATAPLPENVDEYMLAGFLRKRKVELVRCITQPDIEVPADADFVIEGFVDPDEEFILEGPFGDHTGYYSLADWYPRFHVTAITHRKSPIFPATIVGIPPQEDAWLGKATERIFLAPIKMTLVPEIVDMEMPVEGVFHNLVIAKIKKEYPGQAQKVMNAMWGAGQMMFNKILIIVDQDTLITDYLLVARYLFTNLDPGSDIYFSQGPMDVLDHSCSKLGFGGKMCLDGTRKFPEEMRNSPAGGRPFSLQLPNEKLFSGFAEIYGVNADLLTKDISCLIISVKKNRQNHIAELHRQICDSVSGMENVKMVLYVEHTVEVRDLGIALWRLCNNLDPKRDHVLVDKGIGEGRQIICMGFDGTRKTREFDGFERDWPNIIVSDGKTIAAVDAKWDRLGIGSFIRSPSLRFQDQLYGTKAIVQ